MNKNCYRLIFSKSLKMLVVVAENIPSRSRSRNKARKSRLPSAFGEGVGPSLFSLLPLIGMGGLLGMALCSTMVQAQIAADPNAPGTQQPTILNAANGVPQVNIQTPSSAGVSRNVYSRFDVEQQGAILNNSRTATQTQLGGNIQGNPWLAGGSARVILNEVNSNNPSLLNGYVEVAGQRAEVVIANPSGINVNGGGFINASGATLTTASPRLDNGGLTGYQVNNGQIIINGDGLDASTTDYTSLIARSVQINAGIWANELKIITGANQVGAANSAATPISTNGQVPAYSIDVAQLGGMYAGKIALVGTEAGVGMRNAGHIGAGAGEVVVTTDGRLENSGLIASAGNAILTGNTSIANSGTISSQANASLNTQGNIGNRGLITAAGNASLAATGEGSDIVSTAESVLAAGTQTDGSIGVSGNLSLAATRQVSAKGGNFAGGDLRINSRARGVDLSGSRTSARNITVQAGGGNLDLSSSTVAADRFLNLQTPGNLRTDHAVVSAYQFGFTAAGISNIAGDLRQIDDGRGAISAASQFDNTNGSLLSNGGLAINAGNLVNQGGTIAAGGSLEITATAVTNTKGSLLGGQNLTLTGTRASGDGNLLSTGNMTVRLDQDFLLTGRMAANGDLSLATAGSLINQSSLEAGEHLKVQATGIDNQAGGVISAAATDLTADSTLTNRGLIDGDETFLTARILNNLGAGRIYGDHIAIRAHAVNNRDESGAAPVIAARKQLDIGVTTLENSEHALLFSAGDMAIGGGLDPDHNATGQAGAVNNASATIEALGKLAINSEMINNANLHFQTVIEQVGSPAAITEYQLASGGDYQPRNTTTRYNPDEVRLYNCEADCVGILATGDFSDQFYQYDYTRTTSRTRITESDPARILAGQDMDLTAGALLNDTSQIIAGGAINGIIGSLTNTEIPGQQIFHDSGTVTYSIRIEEKGRDRSQKFVSAYTPPDTIQSISLNSTMFLEHTTSNGTGTTSGSRVTGSVNQHAGAGMVVRTGGINTRIPDSSMFVINSGTNIRALVQTDARFTGSQQWLSSDAMLTALNFDPAALQKRLGDGFYEQRLIGEQVALLTGQRFLEGYADDEAQYQALINNGVTFAREHNLRPGIALTAEQMAHLTSDIVWLVEQTVTLADGSTTTALVPQVYARLREGDLQASGALIAGSSLNLNMRGDLVNSGTLGGRAITALTAENIRNLGGQILGKNIGLQARTDLNNIGGAIQAQNSLTAIAGRDFHVASTTGSQTGRQGSRTNIDRVAGLYVTGGGSELAAIAGRDLTLTAAIVENSGTGTTILAAGNNLTMNTVRESYDEAVAWDANNYHKFASRTDIGATVHSLGDLRLTAGNDMGLTAASVFTDQGALTAMAGRDVNLGTGEAFLYSDDAHKSSSRGFFSSRTVTTRDTLQRTTALGTTLSGDSATVIAGRDINAVGGNIVSTAGTGLLAGNNINLLAATNTGEETHFKQVKTSGLLNSGGIGFTIGSRVQSINQAGRFTSATASTVGSTEGNVNIISGRHYTQTGSNVLAPQGSIDIAGQRVDINEARETAESVTKTEFRQSGLTIALTSPVISALQTVQRMRSATQDTKDSRMKALAGASAVLATVNAYQQVQSNPQTGGGFGISITGGSTQNQTTVTETADTAAASQVVAGRDIQISANGAGTNSNLTLQGALVAAGNDLTLHADNELKLLAASNESDLARKSSGSSFGLGVAIQVGKGVAIGITANASGSSGKADGYDLIYSNTQVIASNTATLESGGNTTLKGAVVSGNRIIADVGGNLDIESLQDTSSYHSQDRSIGGGFTVGYGFAAGSASYGNSKINSDYQSVTQQSGLKAGDGGFDVNVHGGTELKGGMIASTDKAVQDGKNTFTTASLTQSDIANQARYNANGFNIGASYTTSEAKDDQGNVVKNPDGTSKMTSDFSSGSGIGRDNGSAASTTASGISGISGNTSVRTGDAQTGIQKIFDADKVQKNIDAQVQITQKFNELAPKAAADYAGNKVLTLKKQAEGETDPDRKAELETEAKKWAPNGEYNIAMNIIIGAAGGGSTGAVSSIAKESLSWAASVMREAAIKDSEKFPGICDSKDQCLDNKSGISEGVNNDGMKIAGGRVDLSILCGKDRCTEDPTTKSGYQEDELGRVKMKPKDAEKNPIDLIALLDANPDWRSPMGGWQGKSGKFLFFDYQPGSILDKITEAYAGTHDTLNSWYWYDRQGNIKGDMTDAQQYVGEVLNYANVVPATPFALSVLLPPELWNAIITGVKR